MTKRNRWLSAWSLMSLLAIVLAGNAAARAIDGAPLQAPNAPVCTWQEIGQLAQEGRYHLAGAADVVSHTGYFYGGLDQSGEPSSAFSELDLSAAATTGAQGPSSPSGVSGMLERYGAVGFFRAGTPASDTSMAVFVGGSGNVDGNGSNAVQTFGVAARRWTPNASANGSFAGRLFHAGAYDPEHDVAVFHGGTAKCEPAGDSCTGGNFGTSLMRFDAATGSMTWQAVSVQDAPGRIFGHSMVYDSVGDRMLIFGGTTDGSQARNEVYAMGTADLGSLSWARLNIAGAEPSGRSFHAAAYWPERNWMVVLGGVTANFNDNGENVDTKTWALDLGQIPPRWMDLGTSPGRFMGAAMVHDANHGALIVHGGRGAFTSSGSQPVNRRTYALSCDQAPTATPTASGPGVTETPTLTTTVTAPTPTGTMPTETLPPPVTVTPTVTATMPATPTVTATMPVTPTITPMATTPGPTATDTPTTPTAGPTPSSLPPTPVPATPTAPAVACPLIIGKVPGSAISDAIANPARYYGYGMTCNPNVPMSPWNPLRTNLSLKNPGVPYHSLFNPLVWSCGCQ